MSMLDELAALARERHFGHESPLVSDRPLCRISRVPHEWCHGCTQGWHTPPRVRVWQAEPAEPEPLDAVDHRPQCPPESGCGVCYPGGQES